MMDSPFRNELQIAISAVQVAAKLSRSVLATADKGVIEKDDFSPVTVADFAIQALLTATIHAAFPSDAFVGEESAADLRAQPPLLKRVWALLKDAAASDDFPAACRIPRDEEQMCEMIDWCGFGEPGAKQGEEGDKEQRIWVFDPIDGTQTFMRGQQYAINVALLRGPQQLLSVVGLPLVPVDAQSPLTDTTIDPTGQGSILFAVRGHGTYVRPLPSSTPETEPTRIPAHAASLTSLTDLVAVTCTNPLVGSGIDDAHSTICARLGATFPGCDLLGWVPRWASMALGLANMTVWVYKQRSRTAKVWDHAGAMLLYEEVGGRVTDVFGESINLSQGRRLKSNFGFVAAPAAVHGDVLKMVKEVLIEQGKWDALNV